jgi:hypothetical protein
VAVQSVTAATSDDKYTAVTGLGAGVSLATSGFDRLEPGAKVRPSTPGQKGAGGASGATGSTTTPSDLPGNSSKKGKHGSGAPAQ